MVSGVGAREFVFGGFVLTPALMRLDHDGLAVPLSLAAFNALQILIENRDRVVTKRELLDRVWAGTAVEENSLNQCISSLRKILGDTRKEARFIATVPGAGYRFVMEVTERERKPAIADDDSIPVQSAAPPRISAIVGIFQRHRLGFLLAMTVCLIGAAAGWNAISRTDTAVLVMPLEFFGAGGADYDYVRKGLTTEIEAALARTPGLHVAAGIPESILKTTDVREVARRMNAKVVLRGQIRESAGLLNFTFELVNPETQRILWSDQFGVKRDELEAAESRVVSGIFKTIEPGRQAPAPRRVNPAAHDLYLRGRLAAMSRTSADLDQAVALYERACELDPDYADAYTGIADAYGLRAVNGAAPPGVLEKARGAALRAVELDRDSAPAHAALGLVRYAEWNWADARRELQQAVRLNPYYSIPHHRLALVDYVFNNYGEAEAELKLAEDLNPYLLAHVFTLAELYIGARKYDDAIRISQQIMTSVPQHAYPHFLEMQAYLGLGNRATALKEIRLANQLDRQPELKATLAIAEGRIADAKRVAAEQKTDDMVWASVYAQLGDREAMLANLRNLIDHRNVIVVGMKDDPVFDPYRSQPAFQELIRQLHLPL
jgi:DNA-binding winged helix-turn-helix (wHTH) protein/TolB-like protein/Tfp pilus assembly protein PilF